MTIMKDENDEEYLRYLTATFARPGHMYLCAAYSVVSAVITDCSCTDSLYRYLPRKRRKSNQKMVVQIIWGIFTPFGWQ